MADRRGGERRAERAVSTVLNYVLLLGVLAVLVSVVVVGMSGSVDSQRERVIHSQLEVLGNRLAADLTTADTLASGGNSTVRVQSNLPENVARSHYRLTIASAPPADTYRLTLESTDPAVSTSVRVKIEQPVKTGTHSGGDLWITYDEASGRLEVKHG